MADKKKYYQTDQSGITRCWWCGEDPLYVHYHDRQWGRPEHDDNRLFEKICLEGFQAGLSWITVLKKREDFREAFHGFEIGKVAAMTTRDVDRLVKNKLIIRHRGKIESTINNAARALELIDTEGSLDRFFQSFRPEKIQKFDAGRAVTPESTAMSKRLKKLGWSFVGPTTCYAFMQAMGLVNDHHPKCFRFDEVQRMQSGAATRVRRKK